MRSLLQVGVYRRRSNSEHVAALTVGCSAVYDAQALSMPEDSETLAALIFHADTFCSRIESLSDDRVIFAPDREELRLKVGQCRNALERLQHEFDADRLRIADASIRAEFRFVLLMLLWAAFYGRRVLDRDAFRHLLLVYAEFTNLLIRQS